MPFVPWSTAGTSQNFGGVFGDGSDGSATLDGVATVPWATLAGSVYTATRDPYLTGLTINSGITLKLAGQRVFVKGTLGGAGIISCNGNNAAGATGGNASGQWTLNFGSAGATGTTGAGASSAATAGSGGAGGAGGNSGATAGGAATAVNAGTVAVNAYHTPYPMLDGQFMANNGNRLIGGGTGGGSGAGDGTSAGGGGGGGAGVVCIFAYQVTGTLTFQAIGGNAAAGVGGNAGGGGGGGGGSVATYTIAALPSGVTQSVAGGALGAGAGTGVAGLAGTAGTVSNILVS